MSLFAKKQEVTIDSINRDFYKSILSPDIHGVDAGAVFAEVIKKTLVEVDPKLSTIDTEKLAAEVVLLRFEVFGLAWGHQFDERLAVAQSDFTKNYLHEKGRDDIWDNTEFYNQAIARSSTYIAGNPKTPDYGFLAKVNKTRMDLFTQFHNEGYDPVVIARALNRLFTKDAWKKDITAELLMYGTYDHLGFGPNCDESAWANHEAQFRGKGVIHGFYNGASEAMENIKIVDK